MVLTGARQTGKTTLCRAVYSALRYVNLDAPENRDTLRQLSTLAWAQTVGNAVIDEAQKEPSIFEKVKYAFDEGAISFTVLTGSSQILLLKKIPEPLAARFFAIKPIDFSKNIRFSVSKFRSTKNPLCIKENPLCTKSIFMEYFPLSRRLLKTARSHLTSWESILKS